MKKSIVSACVLPFLLTLGGGSVAAQSIADLNLQIHGYATQGFLYSAHNSWNTTDSSQGSAAWNETVLNVTAQPDPKLRIGIQARYFLLGDYGNAITLDWAQADYKFNEHIGVRAGKVKTPIGLLNETQDIDPAFLWTLLPQSIYPLPSRNSTLSHYGGVAYGSVRLGETFGKLEYRAFGGQRVIGGDDGYFQSTRDAGLTVPNGITGPTFGGSLHWLAPLPGLMFGASEKSGQSSGEIDQQSLRADATTPKSRQAWYFGSYERNRIMVAGEFSRTQLQFKVQFPGAPVRYDEIDQRAFYAMASYHISDKLSGGVYYSSSIDHKVPTSSARFQKDWAIAGRYDFNPFLYAKLEQHFINGTELNYSAGDNPDLQPSTPMTLLKLGVSF